MLGSHLEGFYFFMALETGGLLLRDGFPLRIGKGEEKNKTEKDR
jgi:hypothetical protein